MSRHFSFFCEKLTNDADCADRFAPLERLKRSGRSERVVLNALPEIDAAPPPNRYRLRRS
jgi:hypothetical protein